MAYKIAAFLFFALAFLRASYAGASPVAFQVDTMTIETTMNAGDTKTGVITVNNVAQPGQAGDNSDSIRLRVYAVDWTLDRSGKPIFVAPGSQPDSCSSWIKISPVELEIPAGQSSQVRYTVSVPPGTQGTFRSMIMFETAPEPTKAGPRVMVVNGRIGSALYVAVGPQVKRMRVVSFSATPQNVMLTLENTGNTYARLKGSLQFQDATNHMVQQVALPGAVVLNGQNNQRDFTIPTPKLPSGSYTVTAVVDYGGAVLVGARTHVTVP